MRRINRKKELKKLEDWYDEEITHALGQHWDVIELVKMLKNQY